MPELTGPEAASLAAWGDGAPASASSYTSLPATAASRALPASANRTI